MAEAIRYKDKTKKKKSSCKIKVKTLESYQEPNLEDVSVFCKNAAILPYCILENKLEKPNNEIINSNKDISGIANDQLANCPEDKLKELASNVANIQMSDCSEDKLKDISDNLKIDSATIGYEELNKKIDFMEPFLKATNELNVIKNKDKTALSSPLLTREKEIKYTPTRNKYAVVQRCIDVEAQINQSEEECISQVMMAEKLDIKPYSDLQLSALYNNLQLEDKDNIISEFLNKEKNTAQHEFHEIVLTYLRARISLIGTEKELEMQQIEYKKSREKAWVFEERTITEEGTCDDDQLVTVTCNYETASFQSEIADFILKQLKQIRKSLFDSYTLHVYVAEMSKLQVENYLYRITNCAEFTSLSRNSPVACNTSDSKMRNNIEKLKDCISILFVFIRRNVKDLKFIRDIKNWLSELIAILLRLANINDHIFILNHLLRCPAGIGEWASQFLQVVPPDVSNSQDTLGSLLLDHLVTVLAILLQPVKEREYYLRHYKIDKSPQESSICDSGRDSIWILVDSSGEDEEDPVEFWHSFNENDILQFLNQIPFKEMFKHILLIEEYGEGCYYKVEKISHHSIMKLFAFCTRLLKIFQDGLMTYSHTRYKSIVKSLSRLIRHTVHYVSAHWKNYIEYQENSGRHIMMEDRAMFARLQVEYDEFFENAVKTVFLSPGRGAWQFLAVIPYNFVSLSRLSKIAYKLHISYNNNEDLMNVEDWPSVLTECDTRGRFRDQLNKMGDCEAYYLLTSLANMVIVRTVKEKEFIDAIVCNIFDAAFVNEDTKEDLNRTGRDLFLMMTSAHSFILTTLLTELQEKLSSVGSLSIYLFHCLSLVNWHPAEEDLQCLSYWLLYTPPSSLENQLARIILAKLNWGFNQDGSDLVLSKEVHKRVALLVVEFYLKISNKLGQGNLISEGVKQVTSVMYAPSAEQVSIRWCWTMLNQLHLHALDQPLSEVQNILLNPSFILIGVDDPTSSPYLEILKKGIGVKNPLALFAALLMTSWGHSIPEICNHCSESLEAIVNSGFSEFSITILHLITPFFFNQHEELISDTRFMSTLQSILVADQTYVSLAKSYISSNQIGNALKLFGNLIIEQLVNFKRYNLENPSLIINFWLHILTTIPNWRANSSVLSLFDVICQFAIFYHSSWQILKDLLKEQKKSAHADTSRGLGSLLTWVSNVTTPQSLLSKPSSSVEFPWFALAVLIVEAQEELNSGLWKGILKDLHDDPTASLDNVVKNVCNNLEIDVVPSSSLTIYRLGQQILDLPVQHPALPLTLQVYLNLHLSRTPPHTGQYDCSSVIFKFFEGYFNANFIKRIKSKVGDLVSYWDKQLAHLKTYEKENEFTYVDSPRSFNEGKISSTRSERKNDEDTIHKMEYLTTLTNTLNGMMAWLDETRLYETGLYIPALPPKLLPDKILLVFQESWELWQELIDHDYFNHSLELHLKSWKIHRSYSYCQSPPSSSTSTPVYSDSKEIRQKETLTPTESIMKRLNEYDDPKPPPSVPILRAKKINVPGKKGFNRDSVLYDIERYTELVVNYAHTMMLRSNEMCALDCVYVETLPQLWLNSTVKTVMPTTCKPKRSSKNKECNGAANIIVEYCHKRLNEGINARLEQNRQQWESLLNLSMGSPPLQVCEAAIHLEDLVSQVVNWRKRLLVESNEEEAKSIVGYGRELYNQIVQLTSDETNSYPPAKQLITSCADILGQEFLSNHLDCQESLVIQVLHATPQVGVLLSPHFTPIVTDVETYLRLYSSLSPHVAAQSDLCFMLLSKFDVGHWLEEKKINSADRAKLINNLGSSVTSLLSLGEQNAVMCLELYRVHLIAVLNYNFPEHFAQVLSIILDMSLSTTEDCGDVGLSIWYDFINSLCRGLCKIIPNMDDSEVLSAVKTFCQNQSVMSPIMIRDTLAQLSTHFIHYRLQFGLYGLYPKYKLFVRPITILLAMMSHSYIISADAISKYREVDLITQEIWETLEGVWAAWIAPLGGKQRESLPKWIQELTRDKTVLLPWSPGDATGPANAMAMYAGTISFFHETFIGSGVFSIYLEYYLGTYATSAVKEHILGVVHSYMSSLPWNHLSPTLKDVEIFSKIINEYLPECHSFIGNIFIQIPWNRVIKNFSEKSLMSPSYTGNSPNIHEFSGQDKMLQSSSLVKLHILLLNILVRISLEPSVRQSGLLHPLLLLAENFEWRLVDAKNYESVINWFVMSCDPRVVLNMQNRNPIDVNIIRLLHVSAGYSRDSHHQPHRTGALKRRLLVRALCRLITTAATRHKALLSARKPLFAETFAILVTQMEDAVVEGIPLEDQFSEGVSLASEAVALIGGGSSPLLLQEVCKDSLLKWLKSSHPSIGFLLPLTYSISKGILQLHHRSPLMEYSLRSLFVHSECGLENEKISWAGVVNILSFPLTNPMPFLNFAAQENHLLVVFAHTKWRANRGGRSEQSFILNNLMEVLVAVNPEQSCETGLLLLIDKTIQLIVNELMDGGLKQTEYNSMWNHCKKLSTFFSIWGEDRSSQGILAAIGLGRKSPLSVRMRLICKSLHAFLLGQLLSPAVFRFINEHNRSQAEIDSSPGTEESIEESQKALRQLIALKLNASYNDFRPAIDFAISFIQENNHSVLDSEILLKELVLMVFPEEGTLRYLGDVNEPVEPSFIMTDQRSISNIGASLSRVSSSQSSNTSFESIPECGNETSYVSDNIKEDRIISPRPELADSVTPSAPPLSYDDF